MKPRFIWLLALFVLRMSVMAQTPPSLQISLSNAMPVLAITGTTGVIHLVQATETLSSTNVWRVVAYAPLTNSPWTWADSTLFGTTARYYRVSALTNNPPSNPVPTNLVWIPPGTFVMGSPMDEAERNTNETRHTVTLTSGFYLSKYLMTQGRYLALVGSNPSSFTGSSNLPVDTVSWNDATNYCALLNQQEAAAGRLPAGWAYRLPTESEFEYACRAGTTTAFYFGSSIHGGMANFDDDYEYDAILGTTNVTNPSVPYLARTSTVGSYAPNDWGLYDMCGNLFEWCLDWYGPYPTGSVTNPQGPATGSFRALHGGDWDGGGRECRSASRGDAGAASARTDVGFRVVLAP